MSALTCDFDVLFFNRNIASAGSLGEEEEGGREQQIARADEDKCDVCRKIRSLDRLVGLDWEGEDYSGGGAVRGSGKQ